jgi:acylphosphatase
MALSGRRFSIQGRVQGVGFRDFAQREARMRRISGYARNLSDGSVLVCVVGSESALLELESVLRAGPRWAEVRSMAVEEMAAEHFDDFRIVS